MNIVHQSVRHAGVVKWNLGVLHLELKSDPLVCNTKTTCGNSKNQNSYAWWKRDLDLTKILAAAVRRSVKHNAAY